MILYDYPLSSASYRVRIALALKGLSVTTVIQPLRDGAHRRPEYLEVNPQGFVPALVLDDGTVLTQSLAIIEYLEELHPEPPLLPRVPAARARVRALCELIACDVHPLNNLRVLKYLEGELGASRESRDRWYHHWITEGFAALERWLERRPATDFCASDAPSLADVCLVPQVFNARRFAVDLKPFPRIVAADAACRALPAFAQAAPEMSTP